MHDSVTCGVCVENADSLSPAALPNIDAFHYPICYICTDLCRKALQVGSCQTDGDRFSKALQIFQSSNFHLKAPVLSPSTKTLKWFSLNL